MAKCEDRIEKQLQGRLESMPDYLYNYPDFCEACHDGEYCEDHLTGEDILSVDKHLYYDIHLSTGGPADFFRAFLSHGEITRIEYHFQDWFDGAYRVLHGEDRSAVEDFIRYQVWIPELE